MKLKKCALKLMGYGLGQVLGEAGKHGAVFIQARLESQADQLRSCIIHAHRRAWQAVGMALGGVGLMKRMVQDADTRDAADTLKQVIAELQWDEQPEEFRQVCLKEWQDARRQGLLSYHTIENDELAEEVTRWPIHQSIDDLFAGAEKAMQQLAGDLEETHPRLARLIVMTRPGQPPMLAAIFAFCLRNEIRKHDELVDELNLTALRRLSEGQKAILEKLNQVCAQLDARFDRLFDQLDQIADTVNETNEAVRASHEAIDKLHRKVDELLAGKAIPRQGPLREQDSFSIRGDAERRLVRQLLAHYRDLDEDMRRRYPDLLNGLGRLQVGAGDYVEAQQSFQTAATYRNESGDRAEELYNAFQAAIEARDWETALDNARDAWRLDPERYTLFPLNKYEVRKILGAGGFGIVFLCTDRHSSCDVVIKTLRTDSLDRDASDIFREAGVLFELHHENIVAARTANYADRAEQRPYLVMDYFAGSNLDDDALRGELGEADTITIACQVAQALHAAHAAGIYHRDLKPGNVLVRRESAQWQVRVIDFGLAFKSAVLTGSVNSGDRSVIGSAIAGTAGYAPPEQMGQLPGVVVGPKSDIYAFGKMLGFLLYGTLNWKPRHRDRISPQLNKLIDRCTDDDPAFRPESFDAVLGELEQASRKPPRYEQPIAQTNPLQHVFKAIRNTGTRFTAHLTPDPDVPVRAEPVMSGNAETSLGELEVLAARRLPYGFLVNMGLWSVEHCRRSLDVVQEPKVAIAQVRSLLLAQGRLIEEGAKPTAACHGVTGILGAGFCKLSPVLVHVEAVMPFNDGVCVLRVTAVAQESMIKQGFADKTVARVIKYLKARSSVSGNSSGLQFGWNDWWYMTAGCSSVGCAGLFAISFSTLGGDGSGGVMVLVLTILFGSFGILYLSRVGKRKQE